MTYRWVQFLLASALLWQPFSAVAQESSLEILVHDMSAEAERFSASLDAADRDWASESQNGNETGQVEWRRLRARIRNLPVEKDIVVVRRDGARVAGELRATTADTLILAVDAGSKDATVRRELRFDDLQAAELPEWNGWMAPERAAELKKDQKVELLLTNETKVKGRLASVSDEEWLLGVGGGKQQRLVSGEVASVRKAGMSRTVKVLIVGGAVFGALTAYYVATSEDYAVLIW